MCTSTQCIQRMQNKTSEAEDKDKQKATAPWQTIWVTPKSPRTNGSNCPGHQEALENSFCCLGCARGQTFTSTSDRNSSLRQTMHTQSTNSASADGTFMKWDSVRTLPQRSGQFLAPNIRMLFWYTEDAVLGAIGGSLASRCRLQGTGIEPTTFLTHSPSYSLKWSCCLLHLLTHSARDWPKKKAPTWYSVMINVKNLDYTNQCRSSSEVKDSQNTPPPTNPFLVVGAETNIWALYNISLWVSSHYVPSASWWH